MATRDSTQRKTVVQIVEYLNRDTISLLEDLLARAKRDEIRGLCFAYKTDTGEPMGLTGDYITYPTDALAAVSRIAFEVNMMIREKR